MEVVFVQFLLFSASYPELNMSRFPNKPIFQAKVVGGKFFMGNSVRGMRPFQNTSRKMVVNNHVTTVQNVAAGPSNVNEKPKSKKKQTKTGLT